MKNQNNRGARGTNPLDREFINDPEGVREYLGGDELETLFVTHYPPDVGLQRLLEQTEKGFFWKMIEDQLADCDAVLEEHGWERTPEKPGAFPDDRNSEPYSDLWFAGKIGALCWMVLESQDESTPSEFTLLRILQIGIRATEWGNRSNYKPAILTGAKQRRYLGKLREAQNKSARAGVAARRNAIESMLHETRLTGGALEKWLKKQLDVRYGITVSRRTIREDRRALGA